MENEVRTVEINGIKLDVDLRTAKKIDVYKVGDNVKVLKKEYDAWKVYSGVIVDFVAFKNKPAVVIAILKYDYNSVDVQYETITEDTKDIEFAPSVAQEMKISKQRVIDHFDSRIESKKAELSDLEAKREYFINNFGRFAGEAK